jgi:type II secretory pathway pseudopilin PulG
VTFPPSATSRQGEEGYSLVELLAVMSIFLLILTGLTTLFASGAKAELDLNRRFEAQQNARLALDKLRRELHCSSGITGTNDLPLPSTPVAAIKVILPSHCPSAGGVVTTLTYDTALVGTNRWKLRRTKTGGPTIAIADYLTNDDVFTYFAQSTASRARLHVDLPVNVNPIEGWKQWRLVDDIVLRNTLRQ